MHPTLGGQLRSAVGALLPSARGLDLATDFDGTLVPIVAHPRQTVLSDRMRQALSRLSELPRVRVAVLSGRRLDDLERHLAIPSLHVVGLSGLESRDPDGRRRLHFDGRIDLTLVDEIEGWCRFYPGAWIEDKSPAYSVHYRAVAAAPRHDFLAGLNQLLAIHHRGLEITQGLMVHELRPAGSPDKAAALRRWLGRRDPERLLVGMGDDANDLPALALVQELGGVAVAVGPRHLDAPHHLAGPQATMEFLEWLADLWSARAEQESWNAMEAGDDHDLSAVPTPAPDPRLDPASVRSAPEAPDKAQKLQSDPRRSPDRRDRRTGTTSR